MKLTLLLFSALFFGLLTSCIQEETLAPESLTLPDSFIVDENEDGFVTMPDLGLEAPIIAHLDAQSARYTDAELITETDLDGTVNSFYLVDGDIALTKDQYRELSTMSTDMEKQYRTNNLVTINTIKVIGYNKGRNALTSDMQTALQWAVANYNALNLNKRFNLTFEGNTNADIVVYLDYGDPRGGGRAGFPSGGRPFNRVRIYNGSKIYNTNTLEHLMTHEIGHTMGLRHTDYFSRESCGSTGNGEGTGSDGAVRIPGTPAGFDPNSVMRACFTLTEDGEFGYYDRVALEYIY